MVRLLLVCCLALAAAPAAAQQFSAAPLVPKGEQVRSFVLRNQSGAAITSVLAQMTDGKKRVLTYEPVEPNQARRIVVPRNECLDVVTVRLTTGKTLRAADLNDCGAAPIVVGEAAIAVQAPVKPR